MFPQAAVWQQLRQMALDSVPTGSLVPYASPPTLEAWLQRGAFSVLNASGKRFVLQASTVDIGSALLSDASFHADHTVEHSVSIRNQLASGRWHSPAWTAVTFYYWSYHALVALTRLLGKTVWFMSPAGIALLRGLSAGAGGPGPGPYTLLCGPMLSASQREVRLTRRGQSRVHDAIWHVWFGELRGLTASLRRGKAADTETRLYLAMLLSANALGDAWPSELRNILNYAPGAGYGAVRHHTPSAVYGSIALDPASSTDEVIDRFEANSSSLNSGAPLGEQISTATRVLVDLSFILDMLLVNLLREVSERRYVDRRWLAARTAFLRAQASVFNSRGWPCQVLT